MKQFLDCRSLRIFGNSLNKNVQPGSTSSPMTIALFCGPQATSSLLPSQCCRNAMLQQHLNVLSFLSTSSLTLNGIASARNADRMMSPSNSPLEMNVLVMQSLPPSVVPQSQVPSDLHVQQQSWLKQLPLLPDSILPPR